jgi:signal peptidase II
MPAGVAAPAVEDALPMSGEDEPAPSPGDARPASGPYAPPSAAPGEVEPTAVDALNSRWLHRWPWPTVGMLVILALDQATKLVILRNARLAVGEIEVVPGFFYLVCVHNPGAAWGILGGHTMVLAVISAAVFAYIYGRFSWFTEGWSERGFAATLICGGILGNLGDRLFRGAGVVDFLSFRYGPHEWPAFNVADSGICVGVGIYVVSSFLRPEPEETAETQAAPGNGDSG